MIRPAPLLLLVAAAGCALANPEYEPDPDDVLGGLLDAYESAPDDPRQRQRVRTEVQRLATRFPSHRPSLLAAAALAFEDGALHVARPYVDALLRQAPDHPDALALRTRLAVGDGNLELARDFSDRGLRAHPAHVGLVEVSAWVRDLAGDSLAALETLRRAERLGAPKWRLEFNRGLIEERRGYIDRAKQHYEKCLDEQESFRPARERLDALNARSAR